MDDRKPGVALRYTPGCILAPIQGARCRDDRKPGVALRYTPGCVLAPFQGAGGGDDWMGGRAPRNCAPGLRSAHPGLYSGAHSGREFPPVVAV